ncbi:hypothetical protein ADK38_00985 [Streptomyces varsoviensis]|uniref:Transposase-like Mu C-terminal domain-containing protein n=1 Tax=Streptomyces varsoviensis TaxID=67373 RepID=A0ABR5JEP3_9ACTN|nr:hypothetical protein ADK38_00985 [Streptomyces varsoviensis]
MSPNEKYAVLVSGAGHVPVALSPDEYIELLPRCQRRINSYGIRLGHRAYDGAELSPFRVQPSGAGQGERGWEVHYDPYGISCVWVRNHRGEGRVTATWRHLRACRSRWASWSSTGLTRCWPNAQAVGRTRRKSHRPPSGCWTARPAAPVTEPGPPGQGRVARGFVAGQTLMP